MSPFYKFAKAILYPIFKLLLPVKYIGNENIPKDGAYIVCANHTSMSDPFFLVVNFNKQIHFMAKAELFKVSILRRVLHAAGAFDVNRGKGDMNAIEHAQQIIKDNKILGIFPEGTRYKFGPPRRAKSGIAYIAMNTHANILPVSIYREGKFSFFRKTTIRIGELLKFDDITDISLTNRANMRNIVDKVTESITELWEMKH